MNEPCVLLVDAEELVRTPLARYLRECGYRVLEAIGAEEAQRLLSGGSQTIDIVLTDIQTLGDGGFAFAAWVRENRRGIRVLAAGTIAAAARKAGDLCEEEPPIRKPYDHQLVLDRIRRLLAERDRKPKLRVSATAIGAEFWVNRTSLVANLRYERQGWRPSSAPSEKDAIFGARENDGDLVVAPLGSILARPLSGLRGFCGVSVASVAGTRGRPR